MTVTSTSDHSTSGSEPDNGQAEQNVAAEPLVQERTPLPKFQLFIVFLIQFAEPVTATVIYPFINDFIRETGITGGNETKTGYYAGIIESLFFISETLTVFLWGWSSDLLGRKIVLIWGPLGLSLSMLAFGLSKSFWAAAVYRCFQGFFNGNIGISKSIIAEITDKTNIGDAYAIAPLMWNTGLTIGPTLGGIFTRPAQRWPETFGQVALFRDYPYLLPCISAGFIAFLSFCISSVSLEETHPTLKNVPISARVARLFRKPSKREDDATKALLPSSSSTQEGYGAIGNAENGSLPRTEPTLPKISDLLVRDLVFTLINYAFLAFLDMANFALMPLIYSTPIEYGGLGMDPYTIGVILGCLGFANGVLQTMFLGPLIRRFGPSKVYITCFRAYLLAFCAFPAANLFARQAGYIDWRVGVVIFLHLSSFSAASPCYSSMHIMIVHATPDPALMGSSNGFAQMISSGMRAISPATAASLFAVSQAHNLLGGNLVYVILFLGVLVGMRTSQFLPSHRP
ncbi:MFS general substrate transporter [Coprinopsis marcescibilis]|uniref:MFS general substrate transporter n=1 Tax=Coprinopsis marcescibilis TaxID=230819 RepID=A0A5C3L456_COPMA|nr:MFS general substrate transporter [Coprinopsis marcescibilis]